MQDTLIERLLSTRPEQRGCPCGAKRWDGKGKPTLSLVLQLSSLGNRKRVRARAITLHICKRCARGVDGKLGLRLRNALGDAVTVMAAAVLDQVETSDGKS